MCDIEKGNRNPSDQILERLGKVLGFAIVQHAKITYTPAVIALCGVPDEVCGSTQHSTGR